MLERDAIFRERLVALMTAIKGKEGNAPKLRRLVGAYATKMAKEAGARDWADLKQRADAPTYDSALKMFQTQSQAASKAGDTDAVRALEVLAISLVARHQYQEDLAPGVAMLDDYIAKCGAVARRSGMQFLAKPAPR
ncbi:MAG: hypothetical protein HY834_00840 [Devosia nanyangense]|uniref:Uncharacterized protein n=1 Tax=Devosia nanyangense TaxID=1228055 RepID=A0A933NWK1_9HYPH|nr:hypothetical protein [Devosia nanyangense]